MPKGVYVEDAQWEEMGNGAMRLTAKLNGQDYEIKERHPMIL